MNAPIQALLENIKRHILGKRQTNATNVENQVNAPTVIMRALIQVI